MAGFWLLAILALGFVTAWIFLARNPAPRARLGPDGTNVREPETFVVHHEGKGQGLDIANTALKERTEHLRRDVPGEATKVKAPIPGRTLVAMDHPPSDQSRYGGEKVAPGAVPGAPGAEPKEVVLTRGPKGSRPETPEEPGSPYAKGRRVTDIHRDVEIAADLLPNLFAEQERRIDPNLAASPSTTGEEPGYGLGKTGPGDTDGEGGDDGFPVEQPEINDNIPDISEGDMPEAHSQSEIFNGRRARGAGTASPKIKEPDRAVTVAGANPTPDWSLLDEEEPLPTQYGEDRVVAMVRNPRSLYVYWERSGFGEENLRVVLGDEYERTVPVLRLFDVTEGAYPGQPEGHSHTLIVGEHDDHWFIHHLAEPGHRYVVSFERRTEDGRYYLISHSGPVQMPHEGPAQQNWLTEKYGLARHDWAGSPWR